jgi:hypothetical protein
VVHSTSDWLGLPFDAVLVKLPLLLPLLFPVAVVGVLVVAMFATDGDFEPPHPASTIAAAAARSASPPDRRYLVALSGLPGFVERSALPFIGSLFNDRSGVESRFSGWPVTRG